MDSFWSLLYRHWIWLGVLFMTASNLALISLVRGLVHVVHTAHLLKVPLAAEQEVRFAEAGRVALSVEGPRRTRRFAGVGFELLDAARQAVPSHPTHFRARTSGLSITRIEVRAFEVPRAGRYTLRVSSLGKPRADDDRHALVFLRPHLGTTMAYVVGLVLAGGVLIVSLVFFVLRVTGAGRSGN